MRTTFFILSVLILSAAGCNNELPEDGIGTDAKLAKTLQEIPESLVIDGKTMTLTAELWRNFMPFIGEEPNSLHALVSVSAEDGSTLPTFLNFTKLVVLKGDSVWVQTIEKSERSTNENIRANTKGGPGWQPESEVDVVVELIHGENLYKLRQKSVKIGATH